MSMSAAEVEQALLALNQQERAAVIRRGLRSLEAASSEVEQSSVDAAWRLELLRRIDEIENGAVELLDMDDVHARIRAELDAMHK